MKTPDDHYRAILDSMDEDGALIYVSARVKEAVEDTRRVNVKVEATLRGLEGVG